MGFFKTHEKKILIKDENKAVQQTRCKLMPGWW